MAFAGTRPGCVFKMGGQGLGYYRDGADGADDATPALPAGWICGTTPEGYTYYWHTPTSTSSWEVPTVQPPVSRHVALAPHVSATLAAAALQQIEEQSGATIVLDPPSGGAHVRGSESEVARACQLLERKAGAIEFAAAHSAAQQQPLPVPGEKRKVGASSEYDFRGVSGFVAEAEAARAALRQRPLEGAPPPVPGGALAALAQYDDDDDDDDAQ